MPFVVKLMITNIRKFNEQECMKRNQIVKATHDYLKFRQDMEQRIKD